VGRAVLSQACRRCSNWRALEEHAKGMVVPGTMFEEFGFNYIGPIDGHDLDALVPTLQNLRELRGPAVPAHRHAQGPGLQAGRGRSGPLPRPRQVRSEPGHPRRPPRRPSPPTRRCSDWLCDMAAQTSRAGRHHAGDARRLGPGRVREALPARYFDVGIAEQHAVTFAAGMACEG
jgi:1-deoxy-D-xylulose-5-phosphate synthase